MIGSEIEKERVTENSPESDINCYTVALLQMSSLSSLIVIMIKLKFNAPSYYLGT